MAAGAGLDQTWFKLADEDHDGVVGGAEAVKFFLRSGLSQAVLGQVRGCGVIWLFRYLYCCTPYFIRWSCISNACF